MIDFRELVKKGVHFGHQASRWVPKMSPYIWGVKNKVHLIDVSKTAHQLEKAAQFLQQVASEDKQILWVGTKKPAREVIKAVANKLDMPFVNHRWVGGTLSNFAQVKKSVTRLLHYEDVLEKTDKYPHYTKKELNEIKKNVERLKVVVGGIRNLTWPIGAVVLVDVNKEQSALKEAVKMNIPVVAMVDTNADPSLVDYVIPANDDAPRSIKVILDYLEAAVVKGKEMAVANAAAKKEEKEAAKAAKKADAPAAKPAKKEAAPKAPKAKAATAEAKKPAAKQAAAEKAEAPKAAAKKETEIKKADSK